LGKKTVGIDKSREGQKPAQPKKGKKNRRKVTNGRDARSEVKKRQQNEWDGVTRQTDRNTKLRILKMELTIKKQMR